VKGAMKLSANVLLLRVQTRFEAWLWGAAKLAVALGLKVKTVFGLKVMGHNFSQFVRGVDDKG